MFTVDVVTGTRAEYGLLRPVLQKLYADPAFAPRLIATGSHLAAGYGGTASEIEADGFAIAARLDILAEPAPAGREGTARRTALALRLFTGWFTQNPPDAVLLLGDRYEIFAAATAAALMDIPVAHISGGEVTFGADDDWFRHCISKMAKLHFPSCGLHRERLLRMGEEPRRVFDVGGLGDENIRNMKLLSRAELAASLGVALDRPFALVTLHPETVGGPTPAQQADALLAAVERQPELLYLFTASNADAGGAELNERFEAYCERHENARFFHSLGVLRYLSAMKEAALVLGNSSSGVAEAPSLGVPTVNIGRRQQGRLMPINVVCCGSGAQAIAGAMQTALTEAFRAQARQVQSPYNGGDTSGKIVAILRHSLESGILAAPKEFYDGSV